MTLPTFLILGAQKAGTTSLYEYLSQHPDIYMSPAKEPHFFSYMNYDASQPTPHRHSNFYRPVQRVTRLDDYERLFEGAYGKAVRGEASPSYLYSPAAPSNIRAIAPDVKMIAILRHPVERAFSNYQMNRRSGQELLTSFEDVIAAEEGRIQEGWGFAWHYLNKSRYAHQIRRYQEVFPGEQLKVMLFDDLVTDRAAFVREMFAFVGANPEFVPNVELSSNVSGVPKNAALGLVMRPAMLTQRWWGPVVPKRLRHKIRSATLTRDRMLPETRAKLLDAFHDEVTELEGLIGRDLSTWRR